MTTAKKSLFQALRWRLLYGLSRGLHKASNWAFAKAVKS